MPVLMDKSINDPQGLQDSIIEMTKQFTYFDDKTNSFKINPGGIRLMKELATETSVQKVAKLLEVLISTPTYGVIK